MTFTDLPKNLIKDVQSFLEDNFKEESKETEESEVAETCDSEHTKLEEGISIPPSGLASLEPCSAIGARQTPEIAKHVDVICDTDALNSTKTYRLLVQYPNGRPEFIPPLSLPAAPSLELLLDIVAELPDSEMLIQAVAQAAVLPSDLAQYKGNDRE